MATNPIPRLSETEYLAMERVAETKNEFLNGEMFAMSGGSTAHARLIGDLFYELYSRVRGGPCDVFTSDHRVKVAATGLYTYPDLTVYCGAPLYAENDIKDTLVNPTVIFEVLSPSTESYDRGNKFYHYRQVPTLRDYLLVSQSELLVEHYTRGDGNTWILKSLNDAGQQLRIESIGVTIPLEDIYRRVKFD